MRRFRTLAPLLVTPLLAHCSTPAHPGPSSAATPMVDSVARPIARKTAGWEKHAGFLPIYFDAGSGKLMLEIPRDSLRALLFVKLATGLGSNPVGIDRGADGASYVARFARSGPQVLLVLENWSYRSSAPPRSGPCAHGGRGVSAEHGRGAAAGGGRRRTSARRRDRGR